MSDHAPASPHDPAELVRDPARDPVRDPARTARLNPWWRLALLSGIAGMVDTTSFVHLAGIFVAHLTGNMIVMGSDLAAGRLSLLLPRLLVLVFFVIGVAMARLMCPHPSWTAVRRLLWLETAMLAAFIAAGYVLVDRQPQPAGTWVLLAVAVPGVFAMAAQAARWKLMGGPATQVMTGNVTSATIELFDAARLASRAGAATPGDRRAAWGGVLLVGSFLAGALLAGALLPHAGFLSLLAPLLILVLLAATTAVTPDHGPASRGAAPGR